MVKGKAHREASSQQSKGGSPWMAAKPVGRGKLSENYVKQLRRIGARIPPDFQARRSA